jgi:inorganic pyrophosphatase/exopolyphosphatase
VKRSLRVQDQSENMKRILSQQKQYKELLVQDLLIKDRKAREFSEYRRSVAAANMNTLRNNYSSFGGAVRS